MLLVRFLEILFRVGIAGFRLSSTGTSRSGIMLAMTRSGTMHRLFFRIDMCETRHTLAAIFCSDYKILPNKIREKTSYMQILSSFQQN